MYFDRKGVAKLNYLAEIVYVAVLALMIYFLVRLLRGPKILFVDNGKITKSFRNPIYRIVAKPDLVRRDEQRRVILTEYKSRSKIHPGDEIQVKAAAIASRTKYRTLSHAEIKTPLETRLLALGDDATLAAELAHHINMARRAKAGKLVPVTLEKHKCRTCSFANECDRNHLRV